MRVETKPDASLKKDRQRIRDAPPSFRCNFSARSDQLELMLAVGVFGSSDGGSTSAVIVEFTFD
jgi:hypothetical protein